MGFVIMNRGADAKHKRKGQNDSNYIFPTLNLPVREIKHTP